MARPRFTVTPFTAWNGALRTCPVRNRHHDHVDDNHRIDRIQRSARPLGGCTGGLLRDLADGVWRPSPPQTSSKCAAISPVINPRGQQQYDLIDPVQTAHALEHDHLSPRQQQGPNRNHRGWRKFGPCGGVEHRGFEPLTFSLRKPPGHGFAPFGGGSTPAESCTDAVDFRSGVRRGPARTNLFDFQSGAVHAGENSARESAVGMDRGGVSSTDETQGLVESVGRGRGALPYPERELAIPGGSALSDGMKDKGAANPVPLGAGIDEQVDDERAFELGVPDGALDDQDGTDHATLMGRHGRGIETESAVLPREGVPDLLGSLGERVARDARRVGVAVGGGEFVSKRGVERLQLDLGIGCWREASEVKGHEV